MAFAFCIDALIGWPDWLFKQIGHPVTWMGWLVRQCDQTLNWVSFKPHKRRLGGVATVLIVLFVTLTLSAIVVAAILAFIPEGWLQNLAIGIVAWPFLAVRSMATHIKDIIRPLEEDNLPAARHAVSMIVGRDPSSLDKPAICRASLESLAENTSDGITAPLFWGVLFGLPGIAAYKAINTMDSMIGHKTITYRDFGWAAARLDDVVNWIPARLTGFLFALVSAQPKRAFQVIRADANKHRSPNAGWPEAAMASGVKCRLSGPRQYCDRIEAEPWVNETDPDPQVSDLKMGLSLYRRTLVALLFLLEILAFM
jgi:adenosylcobinamide-phosphate synthase